FITVSNVNSNLNASIIDMNGRVIATEMIVEDMRISTSEITSGIYFLQTVNEKTGEVKMNKFSKF
ncbi:T9SS type A sorting domain-containing protein, partial [Salibacteraceae bacterium]|nr:T9SS type A sorting domain-containing protein [Salibacteraceae bacterium]